MNALKCQPVLFSQQIKPRDRTRPATLLHPISSESLHSCTHCLVLPQGLPATLELSLSLPSTHNTKKSILSPPSLKLPPSRAFPPGSFPCSRLLLVHIVLGLVLLHSQAAQGRKWALPTVRITHDIPFGVSIKLNIRHISLCWTRAYAYKLLRKPVLPQRRTVEQIKYYKIFFVLKMDLPLHSHCSSKFQARAILDTKLPDRRTAIGKTLAIIQSKCNFHTAAI